MPVFIEDHAKRLSSNPDEKEQELPEGTTIRFEVGKSKFRCSIVGESSIKIQKMSDTFDQSIIIEPLSTNEAKLK